MEVYDCTLWELLKKLAVRPPPIPPMSMSVRYDIFESLLSGAKYIQDQGFKHLDLKLSNVLLKTRPDGSWNGKDCVITDFGVGGRNDQIKGNAGTPGFASPEQMVGPGNQKSDNYSFGKMMVLIFSEWQTAWNILFQPITDSEKQNIIPNLDPIFTVITKLLNVSLLCQINNISIIIIYYFAIFSNFIL